MEGIEGLAQLRARPGHLNASTPFKNASAHPEFKTTCFTSTYSFSPNSNRLLLFFI
ncbi:hypothetical protein BofuT4_uP046460.1 [Botrytis cinerea T4]|uniref:Uncharacterized protein n=1 Tax=Botryotinia fuckeliana (strain T4) TaxID=999810 RepID=G2XYU1_BOTF4|nr:hypothetical protein BofuT4_uP046460.1 [Botrytis cinerea T4]